MKSFKKILSLMLVLAIVLSLALCFGVSAMASTSTTSSAAAQAAADGVFHVVGYYSYEYLYNTYVDDSILGFVTTYEYLNYYFGYDYGDAAVAGSAFLIGYNSNGQAVLVSNYHVTVNETVGLYYDENGATISSFEMYDRFAVSILGDLTVDVEVKYASGDYDFSILYAQDTIANRTVLSLNPDTQGTTETCYALGFPGELSSIMQDMDFTTSSVTITQGTITNVTNIASQYGTTGLLVPVYQTTATISGGCSGGPLVNSDGEVIGINSYSYTTEEASNYYYAVRIEKVCDALDSLGIAWTKGDDTTTEVEEEPEPTEAVEEVVVATEAPAPTEAPAATEEPVVATPEPEAESTIPWAIIIIIAAVIVVAIIVVVIILVVGKGKKQDTKSAPTNDYQRTLSQPQSYDNDQPTDVLGGGYDDQATTILGGGGSARVCLVRESTGERIPISKTVFRIGSKRGSVDYVITNNTAISRNHASIVSRNGEYFILDNNSSNFTFVNGTQLTPTRRFASTRATASAWQTRISASRTPDFLHRLHNAPLPRGALLDIVILPAGARRGREGKRGTGGSSANHVRTNYGLYNLGQHRLRPAKKEQPGQHLPDRGGHAHGQMLLWHCVRRHGRPVRRGGCQRHGHPAVSPLV
ncbi:MAG: trypsin-like peptidase domain-containing protein [Oscillospiraceae bacterium]|nr:trypsin-like peptidase domain-containing protein [Oscillospiraceae bacterium]